MAVNWPEIALIWGFMLAILGLSALFVRYRLAPRLKAEAAQWVGGAIGRFMQNLADDAREEGEEDGGGGSGGGISLGGFKIDATLIRSIVELVKTLQALGILKGGSGGSGGEHPLL